ncbi:MAG TPA: GDP-mannose 4,6-dehydratase [Vicinamibacterales bacterium]|nr:GDP-mannose 4,6-dehydratase [Vicinamibacterales bacterium]
MVTGAAGFAGSHLIDRLAATGEPIVGWYRPEGHPPQARAGVEWQAVDVLDRDGVRRGIVRASPDAIYHCAGAANVGRAWNRAEATLAINVRGTEFVLEAAAALERRVPVLVPSSAMVYRPANHPLTEEQPLQPPNPYGLTKLATEMLAARLVAEGSDIRVVRPFNHIGARQYPSFVASDFARQIVEIERGRRDPEIVVGNLDARRELTNVRDTVRAYEMVMAHGVPGRPYNVASGEAHSIRELLDRLIAHAHVSVRVRVDPSKFHPNDLPLLVGDPSRIRAELGWAPEISLDDTLDEVLDYWRQKES